MANKIQWQSWLKALGFDSNNELTIKGNTIRVDINATEKNIKYPGLKEIGRNTTTNLVCPENFVVLEAIIGLLKQGYRPNQISIEKSYKLGHGIKSGNADITVDDNEGNPFLIIEAKTFGDEFDKEWNNTLKDGGQLFSYEKQENKAQVLVLYTSRVVDTKIERNYRAIKLRDNEEFLKTLNNARGYKEAKGGNDKFEIWRDIYQQEYLTNGVLEEWIKPFEIEQAKLSTNDLKVITHDEVQKKYNQFATILRKYNIGGRENAFDKLVNLFLVKIVDEQQNSNDLQFNWKGVAQDTYFDLVDRLQKLYQVGMEKFLNEKVSYVSQTEVESAFRLRKDAAKDAILTYFKELKYFSNNDFTFLEVYNEQLFYQNSKILVEIVQLFQDIKLKTKEQNQFLGDLFEGFLDNGVKQSEGQFFTPLPIVKFIVSSLPLKEINKGNDIPKIMDYASGAGHFLNEYAEEIKNFVDGKKISDYYSEIYGIEKEYRLSKVSKVSAFMYGQDDINIIYGDALAEHEGINDNSYSVIVANPPYSVKGFLGTLTEKQRANYELSKYVDKIETNNSIELFFLERTKQLLKSEGVAGIIVPSSVLSNGNLYSKARKIIIESFDIIAIAEFGSKTFGSTGTNTITLFLQKKKYPPKEADNYKYAVERWFTDTDTLQQDIDIVKAYCNQINIEYDDYCELQNNTLDKLLENELFEEYIKDFEKSVGYKKIVRKRVNARYSQDDKNSEIEKAKIAYVKSIEREKVIYFAIANAQSRDVVIVKSPTDNARMKQFLGYEWSKRKGQEGIKYIGANISDDEMEISKNQAINSIQTPLFDPTNLMDEEKINSVIRKNFIGELEVIPTVLDNFVNSSSLVDMLDFTQTSFDAQIKTTPDKKIDIVSRYPVEKLGNVVDIKIGGTPSRLVNSFFEGDNLWLSVKEMKGQVINDTKEKITDDAIKQSNVKLIPKGTTLLSFKLSVGKTAIAGKDLYTNEAIAGLIPKTNNLLNEYIFAYFSSDILDLQGLGTKAFGHSLNSKFLNKNIPIPIPPIEVQKEIIEQTRRLDDKYETSRMKIEDYRKQISEIFRSLDVLGGKTYRLSSNDFEIMLGKRVLNKELTQNGIPVYSANVFEPFGRIDQDILKDFSKPSILWGIDGDWMVNTLPANEPFYPTDHTGVLRVNNSQINYRYLAHCLEQEGLHEGFSRNYRASIGQIEKLSVVIPSIKDQNNAIKEIEDIETKIVEEQQKIAMIQEEKNNILNDLLQ